MSKLVEGSIVHYVDGEGFHRPAMIVEVHHTSPEGNKVAQAREAERDALAKEAKATGHLTTREGVQTEPTAFVGGKPALPGEVPDTVLGTVTTTPKGASGPETRAAQVPSPAAALNPKGTLPQKDLVDLIVFHGVALGRAGGDGDHEFVRNAPRDNNADKSVRGTWHFIE